MAGVLERDARADDADRLVPPPCNGHIRVRLNSLRAYIPNFYERESIRQKLALAVDTEHSNEHICVRAARLSGRARCENGSRRLPCAIAMQASEG